MKNLFNLIFFVTLVIIITMVSSPGQAANTKRLIQRQSLVEEPDTKNVITLIDPKIPSVVASIEPEVIVYQKPPPEQPKNVVKDEEESGEDEEDEEEEDDDEDN